MVNEFLSWKVFLPLVRLNYCVYLINFNYIAFFNARSRTAHYYTYIGQWHYITGMTTIIYALAFVMALAVEVPFFNLERIIFQRGLHLHVFLHLLPLFNVHFCFCREHYEGCQECGRR